MFAPSQASCSTTYKKNDLDVMALDFATRTKTLVIGSNCRFPIKPFHQQVFSYNNHIFCR